MGTEPEFKQQSPKSQFLTTRQIASTLSVDYTTVRNWAKSGKLPFFKIGGAIRFLESDVKAFVQSGRQGGDK